MHIIFYYVQNKSLWSDLPLHLLVAVTELSLPCPILILTPPSITQLSTLTLGMQNNGNICLKMSKTKELNRMQKGYIIKLLMKYKLNCYCALFFSLHYYYYLPHPKLLIIIRKCPGLMKRERSFCTVALQVPFLLPWTWDSFPNTRAQFHSSGQFIVVSTARNAGA